MQLSFWSVATVGDVHGGDVDSEDLGDVGPIKCQVLVARFALFDDHCFEILWHKGFLPLISTFLYFLLVEVCAGMG